MNEGFSIPAKKRLGIAVVLAACYSILVCLAFRLHPAAPFSAYMPMDLWIVNSTEAATARAWIGVIFAVYLAIGITAFIRTSLVLAAVVPFAMAASIPLGLLRFGWSMQAFN